MKAKTLTAERTIPSGTNNPPTDASITVFKSKNTRGHKHDSQNRLQSPMSEGGEPYIQQ